MIHISRKTGGILIAFFMILFLIAFVIGYYSVNKPMLDNTIKKDYKMSEKGVTLQSYDREIHVKPYQINPELTELAQSEDPGFVVIDVPVEIKNTTEKEISPFKEGFTVTSFSNSGFSTYSNLSLDDMMSENIGDFQENILPGKSIKGVLNYRLDSRIINSDKLALVPWIPYDQHVTKLYEQKIYLNVDDQGKKRVNDMDKIKELSQKGQQKKNSISEPIETALAFENARIRNDGETMYKMLIDKREKDKFKIDRGNKGKETEFKVTAENSKVEDYYDNVDNVHYISLAYKNADNEEVEVHYAVGQKTNKYYVQYVEDLNEIIKRKNLKKNDE
ncbi:hypothetical protein M5W68_17055 [Paenibacillus larvae]|uniref:hypothetical protein n=1 Tax=Paenibacillus larvae TaxID=1464 RepID=UPI00228315B5|nr:hypothetical protein [Paenibacillus larvae]MCY9512496.1 hypothetical protein [Paenibacillus larvae]MCY9526773.1 hypothetical protein [Paenibacillus larvae]